MIIFPVSQINTQMTSTFRTTIQMIMKIMVIREISQEISKTIILTTIKQTTDIWDIRTKDMEIFVTVSLVTLIIQIRVTSTRLAGLSRITNSVTPREIKGTKQIRVINAQITPSQIRREIFSVTLSPPRVNKLL